MALVAALCANSVSSVSSVAKMLALWRSPKYDSGIPVFPGQWHSAFAVSSLDQQGLI